jgi:hypothetical protein
LQFLLAFFVFIVYFSQFGILSCYKTEFDKTLQHAGYDFRPISTSVVAPWNPTSSTR